MSNKLCVDCGIKCTGVRCRPCRNKLICKSPEERREYAAAWHRNKSYGMTQDDYYGFWNTQRGKCYICKIDLKRPSPRNGQCLQTVAVDHCHETGKVRALLCNGCNKGLGMFKDNLDNLKSAVLYLEIFNEKAV